MDAKRLAEALKSLDNQNFGPNDSTILSTINHPVNAGGKFLDWLKTQVNTAAGIPDQYDNPNPLLAPKGQEQAAFDLAGMAQLGSMPFAPKSSGGTLGSITAWHGSPHKFDKFSMDKIGTGEGAQAYGHGLYFAEKKGIAEDYAKNLSKDISYVLKHGDDLIDPRYETDKIKNLAYGSIAQQPDVPIEEIINNYRSFKNDTYARHWPDVADFLEANKNKISLLDEPIKSEGNLYKTSLEWPDPAREAADPLGPQHFLDWDKPLSEQPESIKKIIGYEDNKQVSDFTKIRDNLLKKYGMGYHSKASEDELNAFRFAKESMDKSEFLKNVSGKVFYEKNKDSIKDFGIPGIRYLDGGSRGAGDGSYNYVVFRDDIPKIKERNGNPLSYLLPATMLGYGMANQKPDNQSIAEALRGQ